MKYQIAVWLDFYKSGRDINFFIGKGFAVYCREVNTQCLSATKKIANKRILLEDESNIFVLGESRRYECYYNGDNDVEVDAILDYIHSRAKEKNSPIISYRVSFARDGETRVTSY